MLKYQFGKLYNSVNNVGKQVILNLGSAEPQGSTKGGLGFPAPRGHKKKK